MSRQNVGTSRRRRDQGGDADATRRRVLDAARTMLRDGRFQAASMEEIAAEAGLSRAGLYLHFRSRASLIDAICEALDDSPQLRELHELVGSGDPREALDRILEVSCRFWAADEAMFRQLYTSAAIDDAARDFVERQRQDRATGLDILAQRLLRAGQLRDGLPEKLAHAHLLLLTSFPTYVELRRNAGLEHEEVVRFLRAVTADTILPPPP